MKTFFKLIVTILMVLFGNEGKSQCYSWCADPCIYDYENFYLAAEDVLVEDLDGCIYAEQNCCVYNGYLFSDPTTPEDQEILDLCGNDRINCQTQAWERYENSLNSIQFEYTVCMQACGC